MKLAIAVAALAVLLAPSTAVAARGLDLSSLSWGNLYDTAKDMHLLAGGAGSARHSSKSEPEQAVILVEYLVPPPVHEEFIDLFGKLTDQVKKEPGVKVWSLASAVDENLRYWAYSVIEKQDASNVADYRKEFVEAIDKIGVVYKFHILDQITNITPDQA